MNKEQEQKIREAIQKLLAQHEQQILYKKYKNRQTQKKRNKNHLK